jgi:hypothetical protein
VIRFSAALVVVAIGVLVGGMATSSLPLVYVAIGLSVVALLTLAFGVALKREEIFGEQGQAPTEVPWSPPAAPAWSGPEMERVNLTEVKVGAAASGRSATLTREDATVEDAVVVPAEDEDAKSTAAEPSAASPDADATDSSPDSDQENRSGQREVTVVPGVPRYHSANCILIRFMGDEDLEKMTLDEATKADCTPCKACTPEHP